MKYNYMRGGNNLVSQLPPYESPKRYIYNYSSQDRLLKKQIKLPSIYEMKQQYLPNKKENNTNIGTATLAGAMGNGQQKTNQDSLIVDKQLNFYAVADGHGIGGEKVSQFIRNTLPRLLESSVLEYKDALYKAIIQTNQELLNSKIETVLAGSTLSAIWKKDSKLYIANVGDSRCILGRQQGTSWQTIELTRDQKPSREDEAIRIIKFGGRIAAQQDIYGNQLGPLRVWLKTMNAPGLAMTRSMGDKLGAQAGVSSQPEMNEFSLTQNDKIIIVASDGVWEYLTSQQVISLCAECLNKSMSAESIAQRIVNASINAWKRNSLSRDDISCIVMLL